ncbi:DEAD/DEAH box helicase [Chryseobacterium arthrosphaerae]|uniref:DEAD/DEAH box helicase n=1 Tax=Chryseobacterium arthrosphaerae TaxID=651561 RepID=UPI0023E2384E|nr:DEAD/DEAH box helicase [Chryseobacterium arthrosphaerae]WES98275.1 DEAD/DEAH box helicase [Chryseobacterium arthrosphaerae]
MNFQAGYIIDGISDLINIEFKNKSFFNRRLKNQKADLLKGLLENLSSFTINFNQDSEIDYENIHPVLAVQSNILSRGLPTRAPLTLENIFRNLGLTHKDSSKLYEERFLLTDNAITYSDYFDLLHIIKPGLDISKQNYLGNLDSELEWKFLSNEKPIFKQIFQSQREFKTLTSSFGGRRRLDFSFTKPYQTYDLHSEKISYETIVFEVDGPHHLLKEHMIYDKLRDKKIEEVNGNVIRFSVYEIEKLTKSPEEYLEQDILSILDKNYNRDFKKDLSLYYLTLLPTVVARLQKTLIEIFIRKQNFLQKEKLSICFIERDIPGGAIAIEIFKEFISNLNPLLKKENNLLIPEIEITLLQDEKWILSDQINCGNQTINWSDFNADYFDFVIDHSILIRENIYNFDNTTNKDFYEVRSAHYVDKSVEGSRLIYCAESLHYNPLVIRNEDTSYSNVESLYPHITYFLKTLFRKKDFREGQLPIISRALLKLPVIGLLPTGGGKSLTFQIPAFLQPSLTIVVDPIKSLMEDQVRVLKENWIDSVAYANSSQSDKEKNQSIVDFKLASKQIIFVSPERFVIENFRDIISNIYSTGTGQSIGYCVIDEVHCLSEWGHDFRYDYLMLGENAQEYCYTRDKSTDGSRVPVSLIGLTATASFDVLADIERELKIQSNDVASATIMIENTIRPELFFRVVKIKDQEDRAEILLNEMATFESNYAYFNNEELLLKSQIHHFENFDPKDFCLKENLIPIYDENRNFIFKYNPNFYNRANVSNYSSITFCAVKGESQREDGTFINKGGVCYVQSKLRESNISATYYFGTDNEKTQEKIQDNFIKFTSGTTPHMVCTKAFGMGIDKDDVRGTFHINYSGSLESLVQECGRAGRDKRTSLSTILVNPASHIHFDYLKLPKYYKGLNSFNMFVVKQNLNSEEFKTEDKNEFLEKLQSCEFKWTGKAGNSGELSPFMIKNLKQIISENIDRLTYESSADRSIHDFFYDLAYKGEEYEKSHITNLFNEPDFSYASSIQPPLRETFENVEEGEFSFLLAFSNYRNDAPSKALRNLIDIQSTEKAFKLDDIYKNSSDVEELWFSLEMEGFLKIDSIDELMKSQIEAPFFKLRNEIETGRMVYRLHSAGLLRSYTKDYVKKQYNCIFYKADSIEYYIEKLASFLRRYQSEISVENSINNLRETLNFTKSSFADDFIKIVFHLINFAMLEIAGKRRRATDEIKRVMDNMANSELDLFENNIYLKEEMYFYFNAKYSKPDFFENGIDCSLLDDYRLYQDNQMDPFDILQKYLSDHIIKHGTEQNNYKHLIGSCKKITFSLVEQDLNKDWLLKLLNAFAMYSTNNISYRNEANKVIEKGFEKLFDDSVYHKNDYSLIKKIFETYFEKLTENINETNDSILDIDLIKNKLLQTLQLKQVSELLDKFYTPA